MNLGPRVSTPQQFHCPHCGAQLAIPARESFFDCAYCSSALYLCERRVVLHYYLANTLDMTAARRMLRAWMGRDEMALNLDQEAETLHHTFRYFPLWTVDACVGSAQETITLPAAWTTVSLVGALKLPPGELHFYDPQQVTDAIPPAVPYERALRSFQEMVCPGVQVQRVALVHVPLYFFQYRYRDETYLAVVDGSCGQVFSGAYPSRRELPFREMVLNGFGLAALLVATAYLALGWSDNSTLFYALRCGLPLLTAPLFFWAVWRTARTPEGVSAIRITHDDER